MKINTGVRGVSVKVKGLKKSYNDRKVLNGIDFEISPGEIFGLLGPNGAGKTTTIRAICQLAETDRGNIKIGQHYIEEQPILSKKLIGIIPQNKNLHTELSLLENLMFHAQYYGFTRSESETKACELLKMFGLEGRKKEKISNLSGGMQQKVLIARALIQEPSVLIMDEPTVGLDPLARKDIWKVIQNLKGKLTVILTTQYIEEADILCDRVAILDKGCVVATGTPKELKQNIGDTMIEFKVDKPKIPEVLRKISGYAAKRIQIERFGDSIRVSSDKVTVMELMPKILGFGVIDINFHQSTLEDIFILKTGKGFGEI